MLDSCLAVFKRCYLFVCVGAVLFISLVSLQPVSVRVPAVWTGHVTWRPATACVGVVSKVTSATSVHRATSTTRSANVSHLWRLSLIYCLSAKCFFLLSVYSDAASSQ